MNHRGQRVFTFFWSDGTDHVLPKATCARYGPADLVVLRDMLEKPMYHGNIVCTETGRHGLNLCSDESIREEFQRLSIEEQKNALLYYLTSVLWSRPTMAKGTAESTRLLVNRYLQWHRQHLGELVRCLDILHSCVFASRGGKHSLDFGQGTSMMRMSLLLDIHLSTSESTIIRTDTDMFKEYKPQDRPKQNIIFGQLDALCDLMMEHGEMLREKFNFIFDGGGGGRRMAWTRGTLYHEFRKQYKRQIPVRYWTGGAANYLRSAFDIYALHWLRFNHIERFVRIEK